MTRNLQAIRCLCGSEPFCPFHAARITGESWFDKICREAREAVERRTSYLGNASDPCCPMRNRFKRAVIAEIDRRLSEHGFPTEAGLATAESIAAQRASVARPSESKPSPTPIPRGTMHHSIARTVSPGYKLFRIPHRRDGVVRDANEAAADFAHQPWAGEVRYLGADKSVYLFERPDPRQQRLQRERTQAALNKPDDPLASIRKYQVKK